SHGGLRAAWRFPQSERSMYPRRKVVDAGLFEHSRSRRMSLLEREGSLRRRPAMKAQNCVGRPKLNACFLIAGMALLAGANPAAAQAWPARNMTVVVPL